MSKTTKSFESLVGAIMRTPIEASIRAEYEYLRIWHDRLEAIKTANPTPEEVKAALDFAPVMTLVGDIQIAATVRIASVRETDGKLGVNIGIGAFGVSGGFGFMNRSTEESVIQISAALKITNGESTLFDYLKNHGNITNPADPNSVANAVAFLNRKVTEAKEAIEKP
ncbi:MAG: hypothetical protein KF902_13870 [Phycisphaeraceae bacterium]|nr:hypothetical protein [Phycisphaeraceae bacterium]